jgi:hypothetical protein
VITESVQATIEAVLGRESRPGEKERAKGIVETWSWVLLMPPNKKTINLHV